ncbi:MAG TPA: putative Ig domain-containing protein [Actinoplanes sp.]
MRWSARTSATGSDDGFTLIEATISIGIIGIVLTALTSFFVGAGAVGKSQGDAQTAVQLAVEATEGVDAMRGSELLRGRDQASTARQWVTPVSTAVAAHLNTMVQVYDSTAPTLSVGAPSPAALPTTAEAVTRNGVGYERHFYLGACWQPATGDTCGTTQGAGHLAFFRVVVAVTWSSRQCAPIRCSYVTTLLVSSSPNDPVFNLNAVPPPVPQDPGAQIGQQDVPVDLQLTATDGVPPLSWTSASGLPPGVTMDVSGTVTGVPTTVGGYTWTATVRDASGRTATTPPRTFTIRARPQVTGPANSSTISGTAVSVTATVTGGSAPFSWQASGLPPGLAMSTAGVISGAPARPGPDPVAYPVTVTVTDSRQRTAQRSFTWTIVPALQVDTPPAQVTAPGSQAAVQMVAGGGTKPYVAWTATGLPPGLSIDATGLITGKPQGGIGQYSVRVTVRDTAGTTATTAAFDWMVAT